MHHPAGSLAVQRAAAGSFQVRALSMVFMGLICWQALQEACASGLHVMLMGLICLQGMQDAYERDPCT